MGHVQLLKFAILQLQHCNWAWPGVSASGTGVGGFSVAHQLVLRGQDCSREPAARSAMLASGKEKAKRQTFVVATIVLKLFANKSWS